MSHTLETTSLEEIEKNVALILLAAALTKRDLPVPGHL